jgi:hypothetical protein
MIRVRITFFVFQNGQPEQQVQTIVEFKDVTEMAMEMARLAAANSIISTHPMIHAMQRPSKIISRVHTPMGIQEGTSIIIKDVEDLSVEAPPDELPHDPKRLYRIDVN